MASSSSPWVLKRFQIDETGATGAFIFIEARKSGLGSFILNSLGLEATASIKVTRGAISFKAAKLSGMVQVSTALTSIAAFIGGHSKLLNALFLGIGLFLLGLLFTLFASASMDADVEALLSIFGIISFIGSMISFIVYALGKHMFIGFETSGGATYVLGFKRSIIEGVSINIERVEHAISLVNGLISSAALGGSAVVESWNVQDIGREGTVIQSPTNAPSNDVMLCDQCGQPGHLAKDCQLGPPAPPTGMTPPAF